MSKEVGAGGRFDIFLNSGSCILFVISFTDRFAITVIPFILRVQIGVLRCLAPIESVECYSSNYIKETPEI